MTGADEGQDPRDDRGATRSPLEGPLTISCDDCVMQHTDACEDCLVTFICSRAPDDAVVIDADEARAMRAMSEVGLVPKLRHRRTGTD